MVRLADVYFILGWRQCGKTIICGMWLMVFYMDNQSISSFCQFETEWLTIRFLCMNYLFNNRQSQDWLWSTLSLTIRSYCKANLTGARTPLTTNVALFCNNASVNITKLVQKQLLSSSWSSLLLHRAAELYASLQNAPSFRGMWVKSFLFFACGNIKAAQMQQERKIIYQSFI